MALPTPESRSSSAPLHGPPSRRFAWPHRIVLDRPTGTALDGDRAAATFAALCVGVCALLSLLSLLRHYSFHSSLYDLGIFHQLLWNTAHGRPFESSLKHMNYLGDHFSPTFALLAPLEWLPFPIEALLIAQAAAVALTGWSIFQLARRHLEPRVAFIVGVGTLLCPALCPPALADIHPEPFMAAAIARGLLDLDARRWGLSAVWMAIALGAKEDAGLLLGPLGAVIAFESRRDAPRRWFGLVLAVFGFAWTALALKVFMPAFRPPAPPDAGWFYLGRYRHLGSSMPEVVRTVLLHPFHAIWSSLQPLKAVALLLLAGAFAGAPFARGGRLRLLAVVPLGAAHFLSSRWTQFDFRFHYLVPFVPLIAFAAIAGASQTISRLPRILALVVAAVSLVGIGYRLDPEPLQHRPEHAALAEALSLVPPDAAVCTENWNGAAISARSTVEFCTIWTWEQAQYHFFGWPEASSAPYQLFDLHDEYGEFPTMPARLQALRTAGAQILFDRDGVTLLHVTDDVLARATPAK